MKRWIPLLLIGTALALAADSEKEVRAAMDAWKQATLKRDRAGLDKLLHPDLTYSHSTGRTETKSDVLQSATAGKTIIEAIDFAEPPSVRVYGKTALVKGNVTIRNTSDGKSTSIPLSILHVWVKGSQGWQMVARQSTRLVP